MPEKMTTAMVSPLAPAFNIDALVEELIVDEGFRNSAYPDIKGLMTIGVGHLIRDPKGVHKAGSKGAYKNSRFYNKKLSDKEVRDLLREDVGDKLVTARKMFGRQLFDFNPDLQHQVVSSIFRGSLVKAKNTRRLMKERKYKEAGDEYLNSDEYRLSVREGSGIAPRMDKMKKALHMQALKVGPPRSAMTFPEAIEKRLKTK